VTIEPLVHPSALVSPTVDLPEGIIIRAGARVGADVRLGAYCALGTGCYVGHDTEIGEFADLSPGVHLASGGQVARGARLGIQSTVINDVKIGEEAQVAAGAVVIRDVEPLTLVAGVPAVLKRTLEARVVPQTVPGLGAF
jgi:acetyltransferase-like isoleucine patch superfamily enzyme